MLIARESGDIESILSDAGLQLYITGTTVEVDRVDIGSDAYEAGFEAFQIVKGLDVGNPQPSNIFVYVPSLLLLVGIVALQRRRRSRI